MYSAKVSFIIFAMVLTGAMRSVAVKIFFQMGFEKPYFVAVLFHIAGLPAFVVHYLYRCSIIRKRRLQSIMDVSVLPSQRSQRGDQTGGEKSIGLTTDGAQNNSSEQSTGVMTPSDIEIQDIETVPNDPPIHTESIESDTSSHCMGSQTGLTEESHAFANFWLGRIPWYWQFVIIGILDFVTYLLRWGAFVSLQASVAEMLLNGLELVLSTVTALVIRKRKISRPRWLGVLIVTVGLIVIGVADLLSDTEEGSSGVAGKAIGIVLCTAVAVVATLLAMVEELMTQEEGYAALIVMGNEGLWGTLFGLAMYYPISPLLGESPSETCDSLEDSMWKTIYAAMLVCLFCIAGMANIYSISTTSSMTRNIWRHLNAIPVWATGLVVYYSIDNDGDNQLGEPWQMPHSFFILTGFGIMFGGVFMYYHEPP